MKNRRQFLEAGIAVSGLSLAVPRTVLGSPTTANGALLSVELFIYDEHFSEAVSAARDLAASQISIASITEVLTGLWYDQLDLRWKQAPMTLAGLTTGRGLFVIETLAMDRGMRVKQRSDDNDSGLIRWTIEPRVVSGTA